MNIPLILGGSLGSVLVILFAMIAIADSFRTAFIVIGATVAMVAVTALLIAFWFWVGGAFA